VNGRVALAQGAQDDALKSMRASADIEDSMEKHIVTPGPVAPARDPSCNWRRPISHSARKSLTKSPVVPRGRRPAPRFQANPERRA
jgi:hypothetical protein